MKCERSVTLVIVILISCYQLSFAQDLPSPTRQLANLQSKLSRNIQLKADRLSARLSRATDRYLKKLDETERILLKQVSIIDSAQPCESLDSSIDEFKRLINKSINKEATFSDSGNEYLANVDSLKCVLSFLDVKGSSLLMSSGNENSDVIVAVKSIRNLESKIQKTEIINSIISQRRQQIKQWIGSAEHLSPSIKKYYTLLNKELHYFNQQVAELKSIWNDPDKVQKEILQLLNRIPAFQDFMKHHSQLALLFGIPADYSNVANLTGLQTRDQLQQVLQTQMSIAGPNAVQMYQQQIQSAQGQLNDLKNKLERLGEAGNGLDLPDYKPNTEQTKTFLQRLELGTNLQTARSTTFFPTTTDIAMSVGYKVSQNAVFGVGASYKVGWGKNFNEIRITGEGMGLRSYLDFRIKKSFFASGGFEYNYQKAHPLDGSSITDQEPWKQSALLGISKVISLQSKFFKKTKAQLLWDFLSYQQLPKTQPIKFRMGYTF